MQEVAEKDRSGRISNLYWLRQRRKLIREPEITHLVLFLRTFWGVWIFIERPLDYSG
jgi:hypothetical protein